VPLPKFTALLPALTVAFAAAAAAAVPVDGPALDIANRQELPRVARGSDGYLAVWRDYRGNGDTYATRISSSGVILDPLGIHIASGQALTAVVAVPDGYLLIGGSGCGSIDAAFVNSEGHLTETHVADWAGACIGDVEVATNGETVLADWDGKGALLDTHGNVIRGSLDFGGTYARSAVASNGSDYLVANVTSNSLSVVPVSQGGDVSAAQLIGPFTGGLQVAVGSDGSSYLVAVAGPGVAVQRVTADGHPARPMQTVDGPQPLYSPRVAWNGSEFAIAYASAGSATGRAYVARVQRDGTPILPALAGPFVESPQIPPYDVAPSSDGFLLVSGDTAAVLKQTFVRDADWQAGTLPQLSPVALAAHSQWLGDAAVAADRLVVLWKEWWPSGSAVLRARAFTSDGAPLTSPVDVAAVNIGSSLSYAVAFDGKYVVIAWSDRVVHLRRFTLALEPADATPIELGQQVGGFSLAAANGVTCVAWLSNHGVAAATLDTASTVPIVHDVPLPSPRFFDGVPVVTWNGIDFAVIWPTSTGPMPSQALFPYPPDDIVGVRVSGSGSLIDATPVLIEHASSATGVVVAANTSIRYVVWVSGFGYNFSTAHLSGVPIDDSLRPTRTPLALSGDESIRAETIAPFGAGFVVGWRSSGDTFAYTSRISLLTLDGSGNPTGFGQLQPEDVSYAGDAVAVRTMAGKLIVAKGAISYGEPFGGVPRVFVDTPQLVPGRRRSVVHR
jgi:hypothetical protein